MFFLRKRLLVISLVVLVAGVAGPAAFANTQLADSFDEWSTTGTQGENGWVNGYYNLTTDSDGVYQTTDFIPFLNDGSNVPDTVPSEVNHWDGTKYDFEGNPPWTMLAQELTHPNGTNQAETHWTIRRWQSDVTSDVHIQWSMRKSNVAAGDGVTGILLINGTEVDTASIAFNDSTGVTRNVFTGIASGDLVELALTSFANDTSDDSFNRLTISKRTRVDSFDDWSTSGTQGEVGWFNGYYNLTADTNSGDGVYQTTDFIPFLNDGSNVPETDPTEVNHWNGSAYDFENNTPWTFLAEEQAHPSGTNSADEHWTIRRWQSDIDREVKLTWHLRAQNPGGVGTTGILLLNGAELDRATTNDTATGVTRSVVTTIATSDLVELALTPEGAGGDTNDTADDSFTRLTISKVELADSFDEWSTTGTQGENGWFNGYYNLTADGDGVYQTSDFFQFLNDGSGVPETDPTEVNHWDGSAYDFENSTPWTLLAQEQTHPNGTNTGDEHWTIRRWESDAAGDVEIRWEMRKSNVNCGDGVTGILLVNETEVDTADITFNDAAGVTRSVFMTIAVGDLIELALTPVGADGCDDSLNRLTVLAGEPVPVELMSFAVD